MKKNIFLLLFCIIHFVSYAQDSLLTAKEKTLLEKLRNFRKPNGEFNLYDNLSLKDYKHPLLKAQIIRLLSTKWTEEELEILSKRFITFENIDRDTKAILKQYPQKKYQQTYDSLVLKESNHNKKNIIKAGANVASQTISLAGLLYMKDAIPLLKEGINNPYKYDTLSIYVSLARMKVEPYYSLMIQKYDKDVVLENYYKQDEDFHKEYQKNNGGNIGKTKRMEQEIYTTLWSESIVAYAYINTQESINQIEKWLYVKGKYVYGSPGHGDMQKFPIINNVVLALFYLIHNTNETKEFKKYFENNFQRISYNLQGGSITDADIKFMRDYFKNNKTILNFDRY